MALPKGSRVYIDTMIWVYHLAHQRHPEYPRCKQLLDQVLRKELTAVSSSFVLTEIVSATRKVLSELRGAPLSKQDVQNIRAAAISEMKRFQVDIQDADTVASQASPHGPMFARASNLIDDCGGGLIMRKGVPVWKGLGGADAIHLSIAERLNSDILATCDADFKHTTSPVITAVLRETY